MQVIFIFTSVFSFSTVSSKLKTSQNSEIVGSLKHTDCLTYFHSAGLLCNHSLFLGVPGSPGTTRGNSMAADKNGDEKLNSLLIL